MAVFRSSNSLAIFLLVFGKALGIAGLILGSVNRTGGAILLVMDGLFITAALVIALRNGREQAKEANADKEVVARLVREGALKQYLREIESEKKDGNAADDDASGDDEDTKAGIAADEALGIVTEASLVGPFRDTGGGLARREGPEDKGATLDPKADYSWGSVAVGWRKAPSDAAGVDLDDRAVNRRAQYGGKIEGPLQRQSWRRDRVGQDWQEKASHVVAPLEAPRHYRRHMSRN